MPVTVTGIKRLMEKMLTNKVCHLLLQVNPISFMIHSVSILKNHLQEETLTFLNNCLVIKSKIYMSRKKKDS